MKTKLKNLLGFVFFVVMLLLALYGCMRLVEYKDARIKYHDFFEAETNFDVIFMGTSHAYNSILPMELWREYGISSYNWGYSNCTPAESYYILKDVLKYTKPKLIVLDMFGLMEYENYDGYGNGKYRPDRIEQQHVQFDAIPLSLNKIEAAYDIFDDYENNTDFVFNFMMYHNRWNELTKADLFVEPSPEKGAQMLVGHAGGVGYNSIGEEQTRELDSVCYDYFIDFLDYCDENQIKVLCIYLPFPADASCQKSANSIHDVVDDYLRAFYVNMLNMNLLDFSTDIYADRNHLNFTGACKATSWLGEYITEHYYMEDYSQNESWIADYEEYLQFKIDNLNSHSNLIDKLTLLYGDDFDVEINVRRKCSYLTDNYTASKFLQNLGDRLTYNVTSGMVEFGDRKCDLSITVKRADTGEVVDSQGYVYYDGKLSAVN